MNAASSLPLPTIPYTVIRVTWENGKDAVFTLHGQTWRSFDGGVLTGAHIASFEILAEPRS